MCWNVEFLTPSCFSDSFTIYLNYAWNGARFPFYFNLVFKKIFMFLRIKTTELFIIRFFVLLLLYWRTKYYTVHHIISCLTYTFRVIPLPRPVMFNHLQEKIGSIFNDDLSMNYDSGEVSSTMFIHNILYIISFNF